MSMYDVTSNDISGVAYDIDELRLQQAYDINENPLIDDVQILPNHSSGTDTGKYFQMTAPSYRYPLYEVVNFMQVSTSQSYQSFGYNPDSNVFYKFDASTTVEVYNSSFQRTGSITLPQTAGHTGDNCYYNGKMYFPGDIESDGVFVWDIANNTVAILPVYGVTSPISPAQRIMGGICNVPDENGYLYLVYADRQPNAVDHASTDKMLVYKYDLSTYNATMMCELTWDCVYAQGSTIHGGILYTACNSPTTGTSGNYTGITLKAIRTDTWEQIPSIVATGIFEPEGLNVYPFGDNDELMMGVAKYGELAMATRFSAPYKLI